MKASIYVSADFRRQSEIDKQINKAMNAIHKRGWVAVRTYIDSPQNGVILSSRPKFTEMLGDVANHRDFDVIVTSISSLSLPTATPDETIIERYSSLDAILNHAHLEFVCTETGADTTAASGKKHEVAQSLWDYYERVGKSLLQAAAQAANTTVGTFVTDDPEKMFGNPSEPLVPNPDEGEPPADEFFPPPPTHDDDDSPPPSDPPEVF